MVYINSSGTTELFTGAYNKRVEQNKNRAAAEAQRAERKSIYDLRDESMAKIPAPNAVNVSAAVKKSQKDAKASMEIGKVKHTKEQEQENKKEYQALFDSLMQKQDSVSNIFNSLQNTLVGYAFGGSKNSNVLAMLQERNFAAIHHMSNYWSRLLG